MQLPTGVDEIFGDFREHDEAFRPARILLLGWAVAAVILAFRPRGRSRVAVSAILAPLRAWFAPIFHLVFLTPTHLLANVYSAVALAGVLVCL